MLLFQLDLSIFQALWDQNFRGEINTLAVFQDHQFSLWKMPHDSANVFWKGEGHYGCGFNVNRGHKSARKMEGGDVSREHLVPILVLLIKAPSLLGPRIYKQGRAGWGCEGQRHP